MTPMRALLPLLVLLAFATTLFAQPTIPPAEPYKAAVAELEKLIEHEVADKKLPALSIALVDDQKVVWAAGFGFQDRDKKIPATAETVYRVGSVSKLFTDVAIMQLVEEGQARPRRAGREVRPGVQARVQGRAEADHAADADGPPLRAHPRVAGRQLLRPDRTVARKERASLNGIELVYPPGERTKYSNAAIGARRLRRCKRRRTSSSRRTCSAACSIRSA